jgi:macrolide transport system ATP-binding/permease protein
MHGMLADLRYALRTFRRAPGFYFVAMAILATGIGSSVAIFSFGDGILVRPLPYRDPDRLVMLTAYSTLPPFDSNGSLSYHDYLQFKAHNRSFSDLAVTFRTGWSRVILNGATEPVTIQGAFVSPNLFSMFGRQPLIGRSFTEDENRRAERVVVIGEGLAAQRFGSAQQAIGQDVILGHDRWRVLGVMPADFRVPFLDTELWAPVLSHPDWSSTEETNPLELPRWDVMARLKPGVSRAAAQAEVDSIDRGLRAALPEFHQDRLRVVPLREHFTGKLRKPLWLLAGAVAFLLCIACANVANLLLARASHREREMAIRTALGAGRSRILRQLITESVLLSGAGGGLGMVAAFWLVPLLKALSPANTPLLNSVGMDARALMFAFLVSMAVGVLLGIAPVLSRAHQQANESLKAGGRTATEGRRSKRFKGALVAAEFAIAMVLLTGAGLLIRSLITVLSIDPGFQTDRILTIQIGLPDATAGQATQFYREACARMRTLPGVEAAGGISNLFFLDETRTHALRQVEGHPPEPKSAWTPLVWAQVTGDYFEAMGIPLRQGRFFNDRDDRSALPVAIVNETLARRYWPHEDAVGKRLKGFDPRGAHDDWLTVVGVVADTRSGGLERKPMSQIYEVQAQRGDAMGSLVVRARGSAGLAASLRTLLRSLNPGVMISSISSMGQLLDRQEMPRRFETWLISLFSSLALGLAGFGVFAVMHFSVAARRNEIGVRVALGANRIDITRLVLGDGARLAVCGILVGALAAAWASHLLTGMLYEIPAGDPMTIVAAALVLLLCALLGTFLPARAASRVDPITALREE